MPGCRTMLLFLVLLCPAKGLAFTRARNTWGILSGDETRILVMRSDSRLDDRLKTAKITLSSGRTLMLREVFPKSGCYETLSLAPVWQVDWYEFESELVFTPDFSRIARLNIHALGATGSWGLKLYADGKEIRQYHVDDLVTSHRQHILFPLSNMDWHSQWYDRFDRRGEHLIFSTARRGFRKNWTGEGGLDLGFQEHYEFDLNTGAMLERRVSGQWRVPLALMVLLTLPAIMVFLKKRADRKITISPTR